MKIIGLSMSVIEVPVIVRPHHWTPSAEVALIPVGKPEFELRMVPEGAPKTGQEVVRRGSCR